MGFILDCQDETHGFGAEVRRESFSIYGVTPEGEDTWYAERDAMGRRKLGVGNPPDRDGCRRRQGRAQAETQGRRKCHRAGGGVRGSQGHDGGRVMPRSNVLRGIGDDFRWSVPGVSGDVSCELRMTHGRRQPHTAAIALFRDDQPEGTPSLVVRVTAEQLHDIAQGAEELRNMICALEQEANDGA